MIRHTTYPPDLIVAVSVSCKLAIATTNTRPWLLSSNGTDPVLTLYSVSPLRVLVLIKQNIINTISGSGKVNSIFGSGHLQSF